MATHNFSSDHTTQININASNDTWIVEKGVTVDVAATSAIYESPAFDNSTVIIRGKVISGDLNFAAVLMEGTGNSIAVEKTGSVTGIYGIAGAIGDSVRNAGLITASINGVEADIVTNTGTIDAQFGVLMRHDGATFSNGRKGEVTATDTAVYDDTAAGTTTLTNRGVLAGDVYAVNSVGASEMTLTNFGRIKGEVYLGDGADQFINKGGKTGSFDISGGDGDDVYTIDVKNMQLRESAGEGYDTVSTTTSHTLQANFEQLVLRGNADTYGHGNAEGNAIHDNSKGDNELLGYDGNDELYGGAGKNLLDGGTGMDVIVSGSGNEKLTGGDDADTFAFTKGDGRDVITDFKDLEDLIDLSNYDGIDDAGDLTGRVTQLNLDLEIKLLNGDRILIKNFDSNDLQAGDFIF
jgi:Ca2+-binding RTX toxin-like protein